MMDEESTVSFPWPRASNLRALLVGRKEGPVEKLPGFSKEAGHRIPEGLTPASEAFMQKVGHPLVKAEGEALFQRIRQEFGWKRREMTYQEGAGLARLQTPAFQVDLWIEGQAGNPAVYLLQCEVEISEEAILEQEASFSGVFSPLCDQVHIRSSRDIPVVDLIDRLEEEERWAKCLDYPADARWFTLTLGKPPVILRVEKGCLIFQILPGGDLPGLLRGVKTLFPLLHL